jgi:transketolase
VKGKDKIMSMAFEHRRAVYIDISREKQPAEKPLAATELGHFERFDLIYRSLCALLFNYVPTSGHPGGSISSGRIMAGIVFDAMDYDLSDPDREDADIISFAAGHKAMGLYALWALRNEIARMGAPELLPKDERLQLRLEDLLGFRRNPITKTPLFVKFHAKALDGHPTPATPFVRLSTGASGVGLATSLGLAFGALDTFGDQAPRVHIVEGEGGMTPGRVAEAMAAAGTASLKNAILHVDWNQASIDSNHVCREGSVPGDYVQWNPMEFAFLHDWNVILVPDGRDFRQIHAAQRKAAALGNSQPTAIVYRTTKGWQYGVEGKASHGAGHKLCADGFYEALKPLYEIADITLPRCESNDQRCQAGQNKEVIEECLWEALTCIRTILKNDPALVDVFASRLLQARDRLNRRGRQERPNAPTLATVFDSAAKAVDQIPAELTLAPGKTTTLRGELGRVLQFYNQISGGAILAASADLLGSTSVNTVAQGFPEGYYNADTNPGSRTLAVGGICEDAMAGILAGISSYGHHIGVGSSYGAFIAALGHIAARLHSIGNQARQMIAQTPYRTFILVCAHAGLKTGEDGPTHADPQALQLLQENFPRGTVITLTPWDPQEVWVLMAAALTKRPAVIAPFVTRPNEKVIQREALGLAPAIEAASGLYLLRQAQGKGDGILVLQGSEVAYAFIEGALPLLEKQGIDLNVYYVASTELFDLLSDAEKERLFPDKCAQTAMGITGFTLPTMYRWICSERGRKMTLHPFQKGHYLGSGQADMVLAEAGLDGESQFKAIKRFLG